MPPPDAQAPRVVPAARGLAWLAAALTLLRAQFVRLLLAGLLVQFIASLLQLAGLGLLLALLLPALSAGVLTAFHLAANGESPPPHCVFRPLVPGPGLLRLLGLAALMLAVSFVVMAAVMSGASVEGLNAELVERLRQGDTNAVLELDPRLIMQAAVAVGLGAAIAGTLAYFAVPLIWFSGQPVTAALRDGLRGLVRNWRPLLVLGGVVILAGLPLAVMMSVVMAQAMVGQPVSPVAAVLVMLLVLLYQLALFGTQYVSFRDIFLPPNGPAAGEDPDEGQLVA